MTERLRFTARLFGTIAPAVMIVSTVYTTIFLGFEANITVKVMWQIIAVSLLCSLVGPVLSGEKKEPSKKAMLLRNVLCFLYENTVVLVCAFIFKWTEPSDPEMTAAMELCIITVFGAVYLVSYLYDRSDAEKMNRMLRRNNSDNS